MLTLNDLLTPHAAVREVPLKDRPGSVYVRALPAIEALNLFGSVKTSGDDSPRLTAIQVAAYLCDASGVPLGTIEQCLSMLATLSQRDVSAILRAGTEMNRIDGNAIEGAAKN